MKQMAYGIAQRKHKTCQLDRARSHQFGMIDKNYETAETEARHDQGHKLVKIEISHD